MVKLSNILPCDDELTKLLNYLQVHQNDEPFVVKSLKDDNRYYLREDKSGYSLISLAREVPQILSEDRNNKGYERIRYKNHNLLKHRLIYELYGDIPEGINFDEMEIHHINGNILDNRLSNLYLIPAGSHKILHLLIDKYGIENIEL